MTWDDVFRAANALAERIEGLPDGTLFDHCECWDAWDEVYWWVDGYGGDDIQEWFWAVEAVLPGSTAALREALGTVREADEGDRENEEETEEGEE